MVLFLFYTHYVVIFIRQVFISIDVEQSKSVNAGRMRYYRDCKIYILNKVLKLYSPSYEYRFKSTLNVIS